MMRPRKSVSSLAIAFLLISAPAFADTSDSDSSPLSGLSRFFSGLFHSSTESVESNPQTGAPAEEQSQPQAQVQLQAQVQAQAEPEQPVVVATQTAPRPVNWSRRPEARPVFRAYEKYNPQDPDSFNRILDAMKEDEGASALVLSVLSESGKSDLSEIVQIKPVAYSFESGNSAVSVSGDTPGSVLAGWPGIAQDGSLLVDSNPGSRIVIEIQLNSHSNMIDLYSTLIHELTHVQGALKKLKTKNLLDVLDYRDGNDYALDKIDGSGGEVDAFSAEISAVIRYRNRYRLPYESFHTPITERFFNSDTGEIVNREGLRRYLMSSGGSAGYLGSYSSVFQSYTASQLKYNESLYDRLKQSPSYEGNAQVREEASRLYTRAQRIRSQLSSTLN
jgi:hypothetical protein